MRHPTSAARRSARGPADIEARLRATLELVPVGIAHISLDGDWLLVNRTLCDILGYSREELLARRCQDLAHPADLALDLEHVSRMLAGEQETYTYEKRCARKDGTIAWAELTLSLVRDEDTGDPLYFVWIVEGSARGGRRAPSASGSKRNSTRLKRWRRSAGWRAASRTTSTTFSRSLR